QPGVARLCRATPGFRTRGARTLNGFHPRGGDGFRRGGIRIYTARTAATTKIRPRIELGLNTDFRAAVCPCFIRVSSVASLPGFPPARRASEGPGRWTSACKSAPQVTPADVFPRWRVGLVSGQSMARIIRVAVESYETSASWLTNAFLNLRKSF